MRLYCIMPTCFHAVLTSIDHPPDANCLLKIRHMDAKPKRNKKSTSIYCLPKTRHVDAKTKDQPHLRGERDRPLAPSTLANTSGICEAVRVPLLSMNATCPLPMNLSLSLPVPLSLPLNIIGGQTSPSRTYTWLPKRYRRSMRPT